MKRSNKLALCVFLMVTAIFVWVPKPKITKGVSPTTPSVAFDQAMPVTRAVPRKRTEFVDWPRNPFVWPKGREETINISNLTVFAIIWEGEKAEAMINELIVHVGDKIADKTVKQIEQNRVILTDGTKDYILEFQE